MNEILKGIKNIIFDFGGVVFEINPQLSVDAFKNFGINDIGNTYSELEKDKLFEQLETGRISDDDFRRVIHLGITKVNVGTGLKDSFTKAMKTVFQEKPDTFDSRKVIAPAREAVKETALRYLKLFRGVE